MNGPDVLKAAKTLVLYALKHAPSGLTNAEVNERTHLNLPIRNHRGYITWTVLQHLIDEEKVRRVGRRYKLR